MTWTCIFCGKENYQDDSIGHRPPRCTRCLRPRASKEHRLADLQKQRQTYTEDLKRSQDLITRLAEVLSGIEDEAAGVRVELMDHEEEARLALDAIAHVDEQIAIARGTPVDHRTRRALQDRKDGIYDNTKWGVAP